MKLHPNEPTLAELQKIKETSECKDDIRKTHAITIQINRHLASIKEE